jgi:cathepsin F
MKLLVALALIGVAAAFTVNSDNVNAALQFQSFMTQFNKKYETTAEYDHAFDNFKATLKRLDGWTAKGRKGFGITKYADLSTEEFRSKYLMPKGNAAMNIKEMKKRFTTGEGPHFGHKHARDPTTFNWVDQNATTPVKDQQQCGSCWAFSTTENFESMYYLKHKGKIPVLGPQQLVDCDPQSQGCGGGWTYWAFEYLMTAGGQETEADYPYQAQNGDCQFDKSKIAAGLSNYKFATTACESGPCPVQDTVLKSQLLQEGPLSVCVDAESWSDWTGPEPMMASDCPGDADDIDHCVQLVGYDLSDTSNKYWILRNSWNTDWGQQGYMYLQFGANTCGLGDVATYAVPK